MTTAAIPKQSTKQRFTARIPYTMQETLQDAAELTGTTVNQFVVQTAYQEAQRLLERELVIRLSREDAQKISELIEKPPKPAKKLKEAVKQLRRTVRA